MGKKIWIERLAKLVEKRQQADFLLAEVLTKRKELMALQDELHGELDDLVADMQQQGFEFDQNELEKAGFTKLP